MKTKEEYTREISENAENFKKSGGDKKQFIEEQLILMEECLSFCNLTLTEKLKLKQGIKMLKTMGKFL